MFLKRRKYINSHTLGFNRKVYTTLFILMALGLHAQSFVLASNNKTILCDSAANGATGVVNGKTYTKVNRSQLVAKIAANEDVSCVCTSGITNMSGLFQNNQTFNQDISSWDTSDVSNMMGLFQNAQAFNQDIGYWDISSMRDQNGVNQLFDNAGSLNQDLSYWCFPTGGNASQIYQNRQNIWGNNNPIRNNASKQPRFAVANNCIAAKVAPAVNNSSSSSSNVTVTFSSSASGNIVDTGVVINYCHFSKPMAPSPLISIAGLVTNTAMTQGSTSTIWTYFWQVPSSVTTGTYAVTVAATSTGETLSTPIDKAVSFSGNNKHLAQNSNGQSKNPIRMGDKGALILTAPSSGETSGAGDSRPWATAVVFKSDRNSSNQHIWNQGEGSGSSDDNIYLRTDASGNLYFGWGRSGGLNECRLLTSINSSTWYGVYIAHNGQRFSGPTASSNNLAGAFDIRIMTSNDSFVALGSNYSTSSNWSNGSTGSRMDYSVKGDFTVGGRGQNRSFHGDVASMIVTTLIRGTAMPSDAEIKKMITDPMGWLDDYKVGENYRYPSNNLTSSNFSLGNNFAEYSTQVWLMNTFSGGVYNQVHLDNATKLNFTNSMSSSALVNSNLTVDTGSSSQAYTGTDSLTLTVDSKFYLDTNGVTIKCSGCSAGDTGYVGGVLYTAHDNASIASKSPSDTDWDRVVTTLVTDMSGLFQNRLHSIRILDLGILPMLLT